MNLKEVAVEDLVKELRTRSNVKSSIIGRDESVKEIISGPGGRHERYIRSVGPGIVLQVTKVKI